MTMIAIATVTALRPTGFGSTPSLEMVLADQVNTGRRLVQVRPANEDMTMLQGEARALETVGAIDMATLADDWTAVDDESAEDVEAMEADLEHNIHCDLADGLPAEEDDIDEEVEARA